MEDNNTPEAPTPCTAGCGFYGNKIYNNMCSKCFKEQDERNKKDSSTMNKKEQQPSIQKVVEQVVKAEEVAAAKAIVPVPSPASPPSTTQETQKKEEEDKEKEVTAIVTEPTTLQKEQEEDKEPSKPIQKNKGRCFSCRVKIPLAKQLTNKCKCEYVFCDTHRYPDKHDCNFDHAKNDKDILLKNNPKLHDKPRGGNSFNRLDSI